MQLVYLLLHRRPKYDNLKDEKLIGIYSTKEKAEKVMKSYIELPGFRDYPNDFFLEEYELDSTAWCP